VSPRTLRYYRNWLHSGSENGAIV